VIGGRRWAVWLYRSDMMPVSGGGEFWSYKAARRYAERMNRDRGENSATRWLVIDLYA